MTDPSSVSDYSQMAELFSFHREHLRRMVAFRLDSRLKRRLDISDVIQESLLNAFQRRDHLKTADNQAGLAWVRMITEQTLVDIHRRHLGAACRAVGRELNPVAAGRTTTFALANVLACQSASVSQSLQQQELREKLEDALNQMDPLDREVLALRHFEELTNQEVADILGLQKTAASNRYVRAMARLRAILAELPEFRDVTNCITAKPAS